MECIFCRIARGEIKSDIIYENDNFFSIYDIKPKVEGHAIIISKKHFENVLEMPNTLGLELIDAVKKTAIKLIDKQKIGGFNLACNTGKSAGQVIEHVHFHILPRKGGEKIGFP